MLSLWGTGIIVPKKHKYGAAATWVDNTRFDSKKEAQRYKELRLLQAKEVIRDLRIQVIFQFFSGGFPDGKWVVDFTYREKDLLVAEDTTGYVTAKKKQNIRLFEQQYPEWVLRIT